MADRRAIEAVLRALGADVEQVVAENVGGFVKELAGGAQAVAQGLRHPDILRALTGE